MWKKNLKKTPWSEIICFFNSRIDIYFKAIEIIIYTQTKRP